MLSRIVRYALVSAANSEKLSQQVNERIGKGWQPFGSPFREWREVCQAIVLSDADEERIRNTSEE